MLVKCVARSAADLGEFLPGSLFPPDADFRDALTLDESYQALGVSMSGGSPGFRMTGSTLNALIFDDYRAPRWLPVGLFDFSPREIPGHWLFGVLEPAPASGAALPTFNMAMWGYEALVTDPDHNRALIEHEEPALKIFFRELNRENEAIGRDPWA